MTKRLLIPLILLAGTLLLAGACSTTPASPTAAPVQPAAAQPTTAPAQPTAAPVQPTAAPAQPTVAPTKAAQPTVAPTTAPAAAPAITANLAEMSFEQVTTSGSGVTTGKVAMKNGKMRTDMNAMGQDMSFIVDTSKKVAYMWAAGSKQAMKLPFDQYGQMMGGGSDPLDLASSTQGRLVGTETVNGQLCDVYEVVEGNSTVKTWVAKSNGFPVKSETKVGSEVSVTEFKNVKTGGVADNLFELPAGMEVVDMGNLPGLFGGTPGGPGMPGGTPPNIQIPGR